MRHGSEKEFRKEQVRARPPRWSPPKVEDLPPLSDLTLDTVGGAVGGSGDGDGFSF